MTKQKVKQYDRLKQIKRMSREENKLYGKAGAHTTEKDKPRNKSWKSYLDELEELEEDEDGTETR